MHRSSIPSSIDVAILLAVAGDAETAYIITKQIYRDQGALATIPNRTVYKAIARLVRDDFLKVKESSRSLASTQKPPTMYRLSQKGTNLLRYEQKRHLHVSRLIAERLA